MDDDPCFEGDDISEEELQTMLRGLAMNAEF